MPLCLLQIRSVVFLHKYSAPTLLVLSEAEPTWAGRLRDKKDTLQVSAMSLSLSEQRVSEIWEAGELPSDAFRLLPVASGGALILCRHLIIFQAQVRDCTQARFNGLATCSLASNVFKASPEKLEWLAHQIPCACSPWSLLAP